ncbi:hypothetical protein BH24ACT5_BH24ACT5_22470 [soil metagenome]
MWLHRAGDPRLMHIRLLDDVAAPDPDNLHEWVAGAAAVPQVTTIRTSALFPSVAERFRAVGFEVADTLALLRADLRGRQRSGSRRGPAGADIATRRLTRRYAPEAAAVDRAAFGAWWSNDAADIEQIRQATPHHRARVLFGPRGPVGRRVPAFAIAGASSQHGYLQRLSVDPAVQRRGHGRALTRDAMGWMQRRGLPDCLVNTSVNNDAALALYASEGFERLEDQLQVLHYRVPDR